MASLSTNPFYHVHGLLVIAEEPEGEMSNGDCRLVGSEFAVLTSSSVCKK